MVKGQTMSEAIFSLTSVFVPSWQRPGCGQYVCGPLRPMTNDWLAAWTGMPSRAEKGA